MIVDVSYHGLTMSLGTIKVIQEAKEIERKAVIGGVSEMNIKAWFVPYGGRIGSHVTTPSMECFIQVPNKYKVEDSELEKVITSWGRHLEIFAEANKARWERRDVEVGLIKSAYGLGTKPNTGEVKKKSNLVPILLLSVVVAVTLGNVVVNFIKGIS